MSFTSEYSSEQGSEQAVERDGHSDYHVPPRKTKKREGRRKGKKSSHNAEESMTIEAEQLDASQSDPNFRFYSHRERKIYTQQKFRRYLMSQEGLLSNSRHMLKKVYLTWKQTEPNACSWGEVLYSWKYLGLVQVGPQHLHFNDLFFMNDEATGEQSVIQPPTTTGGSSPARPTNLWPMPMQAKMPHNFQNGLVAHTAHHSITQQYTAPLGTPYQGSQVAANGMWTPVAACFPNQPPQLHPQQHQQLHQQHQPHHQQHQQHQKQQHQKQQHQQQHQHQQLQLHQLHQLQLPPEHQPPAQVAAPPQPRSPHRSPPLQPTSPAPVSPRPRASSEGNRRSTPLQPISPPLAVQMQRQLPPQLQPQLPPQLQQQSLLVPQQLQQQQKQLQQQQKQLQQQQQQQQLQQQQQQQQPQQQQQQQQQQQRQQQQQQPPKPQQQPPTIPTPIQQPAPSAGRGAKSNTEGDGVPENEQQMMLGMELHQMLSELSLDLPCGPPSPTPVSGAGWGAAIAHQEASPSRQGPQLQSLWSSGSSAPFGGCWIESNNKSLLNVSLPYQR